MLTEPISLSHKDAKVFQTVPCVGEEETEGGGTSVGPSGVMWNQCWDLAAPTVLADASYVKGTSPPSAPTAQQTIRSNIGAYSRGQVKQTLSKAPQKAPSRTVG